MAAWLRLLPLLALLLAACSRPPAPLGQTWARDVTGAGYARDFSLHDMNGQPRSLADYRGKVVVMFFGYTHCPEVCPMTLYNLAQAMRSLGARARQVQVLFVTLDPRRDTPQVLREFVPAFNPSFVGLYGDAASTARTAAEYHVYYRQLPADAQGNYFMDHSAFAYVYDKDGRLRLLMPFGETAPQITQDVQRLLAVKQDDR